MKKNHKRIAQAALALLALGVLGALVAVSGIIPIKASSGHWPVTAWLLDFAKNRSVATHSVPIDVPAGLDDPGLALKGAGPYDLSCAPCHGRPGGRLPRVPHHMTPHPPPFPDHIKGWDDAELFYIVKHGIKFTGMPAWPAPGRDDEIWALVAFLRQLPEMDETRYLEMAGRDLAAAAHPAAPDTPRLAAEHCARCHGSDGRGRGASRMPDLAGQRPGYLRAALAAYAGGQRHSGIMEPVAAALDSDAIDRLATYYAALPRPATGDPAPADPEAVARGRAIAARGIPQRRVPSCADCHGPDGTRRRDTYPDLAGQPADYIVLQLELFKADTRGGSAYAHLMEPVAKNLKPQEMADVAAYYQSLGRD